jgi:hypothetical protein
MSIQLVMSGSTPWVVAYAARATQGELIIHTTNEEDAILVMRTVPVEAAIVAHASVPRKLLRCLAIAGVPTLLLAEGSDRAARAYQVPIVAPEADVDVVRGAFRAVRMLGTVPRSLVRLSRGDVSVNSRRPRSETSSP